MMFGNLGNITNLLKAAKDMQGKLAETQKALAVRRFEGDAGGGMVRATVNGKLELVNIKIDPKATEDIELRGQTIHAGDHVWLLFGAAGRDPEHFADPGRFDITRTHPQPVLTFGGGVHYCVGASLARAEIQEALPLLARRLPGLAANGVATWRSGALIRGPERLPIRFDSS